MNYIVKKFCHEKASLLGGKGDNYNAGINNSILFRPKRTRKMANISHLNSRIVIYHFDIPSLGRNNSLLRLSIRLILLDFQKD